MRKVLPPSFYDRDPSLVAPDLLGKFVVRVYNGHTLCGMITETEAYLPFGDEASHGFKRTVTRDSLYKRGGHAYVYALRHHFLLNAVTENAQRPGGVLIRSFEAKEGIETMMALRKRTDLKDLSNGPGKVAQALAVDRTFDGIDLTKKASLLYIEDRGIVVDQKNVRITTRIGITKAVDMPLRFYMV